MHTHKHRLGTLAILASCVLQSSFAASDVDVVAGDFPVVLTPTRLRQSLADVPASVTVITAEMIANFGIRNVPEALRFVPGMAVTQVTGNDYRINYHGTNILVPRRLNILIDGMSVYRPGFARVDWASLPIAMEDIERIEVTRGPDSASYGANSAMAVINIVSKVPSEVEGTTLKATYGSDGSGNVLARLSGRLNDSTTYQVALEQSSDNGFDPIVIPASERVFAHDTSRLNKLTFRSTTEIEHDETLDIQAFFVKGKLETQYIDRYQIPYQVTFPDVYSTDYYLKGMWRKTLAPSHEVQVRAYISQHENEQTWRTCLPAATFLPEIGALYRANPGYANTILAGGIPSGGSSEDDRLASAALTTLARLGAAARLRTCASANQNFTESRADIEFQDTYVFSPDFRVVSGVGVRKDIGDSQTFLSGEVISNTTWRASANAEYKPSEHLSINGGGFYEHGSLTGSSFSPRIAFNFHLNRNNTLRFVASQATRQPGIEEQKGRWSYYATNFSQPVDGATEGLFYQSAISPGNLVAEKIFSKEIGLLSNFPSIGLLVDARVFQDSLTDLISEKLTIASYAPTNLNSAKLRGAELQVSYSPNERWSVNLGYAYLKNSASTDTEQTQYAKNSGSLAISHLHTNGWRTSFGYFNYTANTMSQTPYGREDLTITKSFRLSRDSTLTPSLTISYLNNLASTFKTDIDLARTSTFNDHLSAFLSFKLTF